MYKIIIVSLILLSAACSGTNDNQVLEEGFPQTWKLVQVNAGMSGVIYNEDNLPWEENLILNEGNTFNRTRIVENLTLNASGEFRFLEVNNETQLLLAHDESSQLVENCSRDKDEILRVISFNQLSGGSLPCDGPGLLYRRIQ
ncbi:hypothetical protein [Croceitalea rosinachiae]|uniref:Lipocalin-like domain-containing protein n=1 Tax=Croceitalea rosinachiae TaxID=3075596 RepID=A0ABU3A6T7_9FLAO|nr:hypothetical protein [Croceitalea sp. F388]MDT0605886.1 hypothetical protein [Croceitalea sp. F388]